MVNFVEEAHCGMILVYIWVLTTVILIAIFSTIYKLDVERSWAVQETTSEKTPLLDIDSISDQVFNTDSTTDNMFNRDSTTDNMFNRDSTTDIMFNRGSISDQVFNRGSTSDQVFNSYYISDQENENLVNEVLGELIPPQYKSPYKSIPEEYDPSQGSGRLVRILTNYKTGGWFVDCYSGDGRSSSNTLFLEQQLGWTGLLVEPDPDNVERILTLNRNTWVAPFCVSSNTSTYDYHFQNFSFLDYKLHDSFVVRCYPLFTYLLALNVQLVDYLSLDVGGREVEVLETIPFDKVNITVISVNFSKSRGGILDVVTTMEQKGFKVVSEVPPRNLIFVRKECDFTSKANLLDNSIF